MKIPSQIVQELTQALDEEIQELKGNSNGSTVKVFNSRFLREVTGFNLYAFNLESFLIALDDSPAEITIDGRNYSAQIVLSHGLEVEVGIEGYNSNFISEAILHTNNWYLLELLKKKLNKAICDAINSCG